jgi:hypothetical protein
MRQSGPRSLNRIGQTVVAQIFDDVTLERLSSAVNFTSPGAKKQFFIDVREAVRSYLDFVRWHSDVNKLNHELADLLEAAETCQFDRAAKLLAALSPRALSWLQARAGYRTMMDVTRASYHTTFGDDPAFHIHGVIRVHGFDPQKWSSDGSALEFKPVIGRHGEILSRKRQEPVIVTVPTPEMLRDEATRNAACELLASLCRGVGAAGVLWDKGLEQIQLLSWKGWPFLPKSQSEKYALPDLEGQDELIEPILESLPFAPKADKNFPRRQAEFYLIMLLRKAWFDATNEWPSRAARRANYERGTDDVPRDARGPFVKFVQGILDRAASEGADAVGIINELNSRRRSVAEEHLKIIEKLITQYKELQFQPDQDGDFKKALQILKHNRDLLKEEIKRRRPRHPSKVSKVPPKTSLREPQRVDARSRSVRAKQPENDGGARAMAEYRAAQNALEEKTAHLRARRLARNSKKTKT